MVDVTIDPDSPGFNSNMTGCEWTVTNNESQRSDYSDIVSIRWGLVLDGQPAGADGEYVVEGTNIRGGESRTNSLSWDQSVMDGANHVVVRPLTFIRYDGSQYTPIVPSDDEFPDRFAMQAHDPDRVGDDGGTSNELTKCDPEAEVKAGYGLFIDYRLENLVSPPGDPVLELSIGNMTRVYTGALGGFTRSVIIPESYAKETLSPTTRVKWVWWQRRWA